MCALPGSQGSGLKEHALPPDPSALSFHLLSSCSELLPSALSMMLLCHHGQEMAEAVTNNRLKASETVSQGKPFPAAGGHVQGLCLREDKEHSQEQAGGGCVRRWL